MTCVAKPGVPQLIKKHAHYLCILAESDVRSARKLLQTCPPSLLKALSLIAHNLVEGRLPAGPSPSPYAKHFRRFARKSLSGKQRRVHLMRGGFLGALLSVISSVVPLIVAAVKK